MPASSATSILVDDEAAVRDVPQRIIAAWADNDSNAFAEVFTEDASLILPGGIYLRSRDEIRSFMAAGFAGPYKGTRVVGEPIGFRYVGGGVCLLVTQGGVLAPGETAVAPERAIRATWVVTKQEQGWRIAAYQNTPSNTA